MGKTHLSIAKARLDVIERRYEQETYKLCCEIRRQVVVPLCDKRGWIFRASGGTWAVGTREWSWQWNSTTADKEFRELAAILNLTIPGLEVSIGSWVRDYTPRKVANN